MVDRIDSQHRSWNMSRIRSHDTTPERVVRSELHRMGLRFRLHRSDLPGCPDIVMPRHGKIILVHGCFWHRHPDCKYAYTPKSRLDFWNGKFARNVKRDEEVREQLESLGWKVAVVWECETQDSGALRKRLSALIRT